MLDEVVAANGLEDFHFGLLNQRGPFAEQPGPLLVDL